MWILLLEEMVNWLSLGSSTTLCGAWYVLQKHQKWVGYFFVLSYHIFLKKCMDCHYFNFDFVFTLGSCCRISKKPCPYGLHFCRFTAITYSGVFRRMEHGKSRRNCSFCYCRVSNSLCLSFLLFFFPPPSPLQINFIPNFIFLWFYIFCIPDKKISLQTGGGIIF